MQTFRNQIFEHISNNYGVSPEYLWQKTPSFAVFRNSSNNKWFGIIGEVSSDKLGLKGNSPVEFINLKLEPMLIELLLKQDGFLPAYHSNKTHWITILLDGTVKIETVLKLIDESYNSISPKTKSIKNK